MKKLKIKNIKIKPSKMVLPAIAAVIIVIVIGAVIWGRTAAGKELFGRIRTTISETAQKIPILNKLIKKEVKMPTPEEAPEESILVKVYKIARRDFEDTMPSLGTAKGYREMDLKFEVNGIVDSINFREGEEVREGDIIASLDQYDALLKLKYAKIELDKNKKYYEIGSIVKSRLEQAELEYESSKSDLDKTYLYAPRDGVLGVRHAEVGEFVTSGDDKIVTLIDDSDVFIEIGVIERDIGKVKVGQKAKIFVDAYPDMDFKGRLDNVSPVVEGRSRTQTAKIRVDNKKRLLLPGMFARVLVDIYSKENAIVIPNTALNKEEEGYVAYVVHKVKAEGEGAADALEEAMESTMASEEIGEQGIAEARPILFEYRSSDFFVIKEGVEEEELIVVETQEKLRDNMKVIITEVQEQFL